jgi:hypothetical protein
MSSPPATVTSYPPPVPEPVLPPGEKEKKMVPPPPPSVHTLQSTASINIPTQLVGAVAFILFFAWVTMIFKWRKN